MEEQTSKSQPEKPKKSEKPGRNSNEALNWRARIAGKILDNSAKTGSINKNTFQKKYNEALEKPCVLG
jgi:hypothetical protein